MDQALKTKWVEALRSGKYRQGIGQLRNSSDEYCCLGVLCDILGTKWRKDDGVSDNFMSVPWHGKPKYATLPTEIRNKYGLRDIEDELVNLNDGIEELGIPGKSFNEIADWIEVNL